jgi:hypothetical protein
MKVIQDVEMRGACTSMMYEEVRNAYKILVTKPELDYLGGLSVDGCVIKCILKKQGANVRAVFIWPRIGSSGGLS